MPLFFSKGIEPAGSFLEMFGDMDTKRAFAEIGAGKKDGKGARRGALFNACKVGFTADIHRPTDLLKAGLCAFEILGALDCADNFGDFWVHLWCHPGLLSPE